MLRQGDEMKLLLLLILSISMAHGATLYTQSTNNGVITFTPYVAPVVKPPVAIVPPVIIPSSNMPMVDMSKIPLGDAGLNYVRLRPESSPPSHHTGVEALNGEFRISCNYSHMLNDDPIVKPNQTGASHLHVFFGNKGANASSTTQSLMASGNSTCDGGIMNRSSYWVPAIIQEGRPIAPSGSNMYYKTESSDIVQSMPKGLKIVAGDMKSTDVQPHMHWLCMNSADSNVSGNQGYIPSCLVGNHVMMYIEFPAWWDGVNLDSADHKSHLSYAKDATHTVKIPDITFNIRYDIKAVDDTSKWRLASDMYDVSKAGGYSMHGDYMFGWSDDATTGKNFADIWWAGCLKASNNCGNSHLGDGREYQY